MAAHLSLELWAKVFHHLLRPLPPVRTALRSRIHQHVLTVVMRVNSLFHNAASTVLYREPVIDNPFRFTLGLPAYHWIIQQAGGIQYGLPTPPPDEDGITEHDTTEHASIEDAFTEDATAVGRFSKLSMLAFVRKLHFVERIPGTTRSSYSDMLGENRWETIGLKYSDKSRADLMEELSSIGLGLAVLVKQMNRGGKLFWELEATTFGAWGEDVWEELAKRYRQSESSTASSGEAILCTLPSILISAKTSLSRFLTTINPPVTCFHAGNGPLTLPVMFDPVHPLSLTFHIKTSFFPLIRNCYHRILADQPNVDEYTERDQFQKGFCPIAAGIANLWKDSYNICQREDHSTFVDIYGMYSQPPVDEIIEQMEKTLGFRVGHDCNGKNCICEARFRENIQSLEEDNVLTSGMRFVNELPPIWKGRVTLFRLLDSPACEACGYQPTMSKGV